MKYIHVLHAHQMCVMLKHTRTHVSYIPGTYNPTYIDIHPDGVTVYCIKKPIYRIRGNVDIHVYTTRKATTPNVITNDTLCKTIRGVFEQNTHMSHVYISARSFYDYSDRFTRLSFIGEQLPPVLTSEYATKICAGNKSLIVYNPNPTR